MPTRPHIADAWRIDLQMSFAGAYAATWGFSVLKGAATFDSSTVDDLAIMIDGAITSNNVNDAWGTDWRLFNLIVTSYDQPTRAEIQHPMGVDGVETGDPLPFNVAAITSFRTDLAGPRHRGRCYIPGYTEASSDGNAFNPTSAGNLEVMWEDVVTGLATAGLSGLGVMSKIGTSITPVTTVIVERLWATQRRRLERARG
jgi:hypothetical protein